VDIVNVKTYVKGLTTGWMPMSRNCLCLGESVSDFQSDCHSSKIIATVFLLVKQLGTQKMLRIAAIAPRTLSGTLNLIKPCS